MVTTLKMIWKFGDTKQALEISAQVHSNYYTDHKALAIIVKQWRNWVKLKKILTSLQDSCCNFVVKRLDNIQTKPKFRQKTGPVLPFHLSVGTKLWISSQSVFFWFNIITHTSDIYMTLTIYHKYYTEHPTTCILYVIQHVHHTSWKIHYTIYKASYIIHCTLCIIIIIHCTKYI